MVTVAGRASPAAIAARLATSLQTGAWMGLPATWLGAAIDATVMAAMQVVIDRTLMPAAEDIERIRDSAAPFLDAALQSDPTTFLDSFDPVATPARSSERYLGPMGDGIRVSRRIARDPNDPMHVEHWLHAPGKPRATVIGIHGFGLGYPRIDALALQAHDWYRAGLDVALYTLPMHGARAAGKARFSGEPFATADIGTLNRTMRQALHELELLVEMVRTETGAPVGVLGQSIGGYLAALLATRDADLDFVVPMVAPTCLGDLAWRFFSARRSRQQVESATLTQDELRACFRVHSPLARPVRVPRERLLIVGGRGDRVVPPAHSQALWQHWEEPAIHWFSGSHLAPFGRRGVATAVVDHLRRLSIV